VHLARGGHLLYGEWLRRERRRNEAREQLTRLTTCSAASRATGETVRERAAAAANQELTAQEAQIVRLARHGLSTPEIGARLFLSPRTVHYHQGNIFAKPGVSSRSQLDRVGLPDGRVAVWQPGPPARIAAGPGLAAHWPIALDTGGYEPAPAGTTLQVTRPPARRAPGAAAAGAASRPP
jgi:DNA-binding CsgD family transcriptional regulator